MTMHLVRGMSSINTKKRKQKKKPGWQQREIEHEKWLKKMGAHPDQLKAKKKEFKDYVPSEPYRREVPSYPSRQTSDVIAGNCFKKESQRYTGTLIKGIATMHKSNAVPIIGKEDAKEIARMRRG